MLSVRSCTATALAASTLNFPGQNPRGGKYVGKLVRALYGTRDAPLAWLTVVKSDMSEMGFKECKVTNGVFTHPERDLRVVAHVDDFLLSGESHQLEWFRDHLALKYELKVSVVGWGHGDSRELHVPRQGNPVDPRGHKA